MIHVVAALIGKEGKFLACRRPAHKARGGLWEFPGGKREAGETDETALARECREELGISVCVGEKFAETEFSYPDITVRVSLYFARQEGGVIALAEHSDARFVSPEEMKKMPFCPADEPFFFLLGEREKKNTFQGTKK